MVNDISEEGKDEDDDVDEGDMDNEEGDHSEQLSEPRQSKSFTGLSKQLMKSIQK